jgi:hypothetical protein
MQQNVTDNMTKTNEKLNKDLRKFALAEIEDSS